MKTNKNSMILGLKTLSILAFSLLTIPTQALAMPGYIIIDNPTPYVTSISPSSINSNDRVNNIIVVAITGNGFIPSSKARVNGADRLTTFIDYSHLLIRLNPNDTVNNDGFYINVFNRLPGGGYSNAEFFAINKVTTVTNTNNNYNQSSTITRTTDNNTNNTYSNTSQTENTTNSVDSDNENGNNLAATAFFGSPNSFLPSGFIQWVLFAIIILLIVIFVRRIFGARKNYEDTPLKHA